MKKTILVTGCAGFIGSNFVKQLKVRFPSYAIVGIDNLSTGRKNSVDKSIIFYQGSILDKKLLEIVFGKHRPDYVFHFAAIPSVEYSIMNPSETVNTNIGGTVSLLEISAKYNVKRFINSSSSAVYGDSQKLPIKEADVSFQFTSPYALEKYTSENFCKIFSVIYRLDTVSLRYFSVFGPGQHGNTPYSTVISAWLESIYFPSKNKAHIDGDGKQTRDFCHIDNVIEANLLAMSYKRKLNGETFNIAEGRQISLNELKKKIEKLTNKKLKLTKRPTRVGDIRNSFADISYAKKILKYDPKQKLDDEIKNTIEWFEKLR